MTAEEIRIYQKEYRERVKSDPDKLSKFHEKRRIYTRERYREDEEYRERRKRISTKRYNTVMADPELHERHLRQRRLLYRNNESFQEERRRASRERYHRLHPEAKYRYKEYETNNT